MLHSFLELLFQLPKLLTLGEQRHVQSSVLRFDVGHALLELPDFCRQVNYLLLFCHFCHDVIGLLREQHVIDVGDVPYELLGDVHNLLLVVLLDFDQFLLVVLLDFDQLFLIVSLLLPGQLFEVFCDPYLLLLRLFL